MNAVNNMIKIVKTYLTDKTRPLRFRRNVTLDVEKSSISQHIPEKFRRDYKFSEEIKDDNPIISNNNSVKYHHA